jgi:hypothetical protein
MWWDKIKKPVNIFSLIALQKVLPAAVVVAMTRRHWQQEKNINPKTALLVWRRR